jgi:hypothetical protein
MSEDKRFYGIYHGIIMDTADPQNKGRIKVQVPQVTGIAVTDWTDVCSSGGGLMSASAVGDTVWIQYIAGDPNFPVWMGVVP